MWAAIGSFIALVVLVWQYIKRLKSEKRKQAEQARKDLDNANKPDGTPSDFLDSFGRVQ